VRRALLDAARKAGALLPTVMELLQQQVYSYRRGKN